jgi:N-acetylglucosaminyldiphosphoundecaprenol N-acetyl-beta-D-mannosaminyltransferase
MKQTAVLNCNLTNIKISELLIKLTEGIIVTPNVDHLMQLQKDEVFYKVYQQADYVICDSKLVQLGSKFLGTPIIEKISGSDFFPAFCEYHKANDKIRIFLLGSARQDIVDTAQVNINQKIAREIIIQGLSPSFGFEKNEEECQKIICLINESGATVLAVGVGAPKQEKWIMKYKDQMPNVKIFMAIGATIDFEAGNIKRAPQWMSNHGLEWLYRLISEPKRLWKRYLVDDIPFFWLILKQKVGLYRNPWVY